MNLRELNGCDNLDCLHCFHYVGDKMCSPLVEISKSSEYVEQLDYLIKEIENGKY